MKKTQFSAVLFACILAAACSSNNPDNSLYYWGNYSDNVYNYYHEEGNWAEQEAKMKEIIAQAKDKKKNVAPGVYAHLGLLLVKQGKTAEAQSAFNEEAQLYPESTTLMQYLQRKK